MNPDLALPAVPAPPAIWLASRGLLCALMTFASVQAAEPADSLALIDRLSLAERSALANLPATEAWNRITTARGPRRRDESGRIMPSRPDEITDAQRARIPGEVALQVRAAAPAVRLSAFGLALDAAVVRIGETLHRRTEARRTAGKPVLLVVAPFDCMFDLGAAQADRILAERLQRVGETLSGHPAWADAFTVATFAESNLTDLMRKIGDGSSDWVVARRFFSQPKVRLGASTFEAEDVFILLGTLADASSDLCSVGVSLTWRLFQPRRQLTTAIVSGEHAGTRVLHPTRGWIDAADDAPATRTDPP